LVWLVAVIAWIHWHTKLGQCFGDRMGDGGAFVARNYFACYSHILPLPAKLK